MEDANTRARPEALELAADGALPVPEAVRFTGCSRSVLYEQMESGMLAFVKVGRRRLIPKRALIEFLARRLANAARLG
jgi:excisionase family DNA binding protein